MKSWTVSVHWQVTVEADRTSLEINEVLLEDAGSYCVTASNLTGEACTSCHVDVIAALPRQPDDAAAAAAAQFAGDASEICPPEFTYIFRDFTVDVGQPCMVRVGVSGNPHPKVGRLFLYFPRLISFAHMMLR